MIRKRRCLKIRGPPELPSIEGELFLVLQVLNPWIERGVLCEKGQKVQVNVPYLDLF